MQCIYMDVAQKLVTRKSSTYERLQVWSIKYGKGEKGGKQEKAYMRVLFCTRNVRKTKIRNDFITVIACQDYPSTIC